MNNIKKRPDKKIRKLGSKIPAEQPNEKKADAFHIGKEVRKAEEIVLSYNFSTKLPWLIPPSCREEKGVNASTQQPQEKKKSDLSYLVSQINLGLKMGGGIKEDAETLQQRPGIVDLGVELTPKEGLKTCDGGTVLHRQLTKDSWKISDIYFRQLLTEQKRVSSKEKRETFQVTVKYRKENEGKELASTTIRNLQRLQEITWGFAHIWDNTNTLNKNITLNFGFAMMFDLREDPQNIVIL